LILINLGDRSAGCSFQPHIVRADYSIGEFCIVAGVIFIERLFTGLYADIDVYIRMLSPWSTVNEEDQICRVTFVADDIDIDTPMNQIKCNESDLKQW